MTDDRSQYICYNGPYTVVKTAQRLEVFRIVVFFARVDRCLHEGGSVFQLCDSKY